MQFQIIKLCMNMIEREWECPGGNGNQSFKVRFGDIQSYGEDKLQEAAWEAWNHMRYHERLALTWHILNKLKAHY